MTGHSPFTTQTEPARRSANQLSCLLLEALDVAVEGNLVTTVSFGVIEGRVGVFDELASELAVVREDGLADADGKALNYVGRTGKEL